MSAASPDPAAPLRGRVALVTGVGRRAGICFAITRRMIDSEGGFRRS